MDLSPLVNLNHTQHEKYRKSFAIAQKITSIASEIPMREYSYAMDYLQQIVSAWEVGKTVVIQVAELPPVQTCDLPPKLDAVLTDNAAVDTQVALLCAVYRKKTRTISTDDITFSNAWKCKGTANVPTTPDLSASIKKIQLSPRVAKRGRPKGAELTVIGLPAKRSAHDVSPTPYSKKTSEKKKEKYVMTWILPT